jgi:cytoskeletal protein RodZ
MRPQINASVLIVAFITLTGLCTASPLFIRDALPLPGAQAQDAIAATETGVPDPSTATIDSTSVSYTPSTTAIATSEPLATTTTSLAAASSAACFPMMAQVDAINSCGKRYGW